MSLACVEIVWCSLNRISFMVTYNLCLWKLFPPLLVTKSGGVLTHWSKGVHGSQTVVYIMYVWFPLYQYEGWVQTHWTKAASAELIIRARQQCRHPALFISMAFCYWCIIPTYLVSILPLNAVSEVMPVWVTGQPQKFQLKFSGILGLQNGSKYLARKGFGFQVLLLHLGITRTKRGKKVCVKHYTQL